MPHFSKGFSFDFFSVSPWSLLFLFQPTLDTDALTNVMIALFQQSCSGSFRTMHLTDTISRSTQAKYKALGLAYVLLPVNKTQNA